MAIEMKIKKKIEKKLKIRLRSKKKRKRNKGISRQQLRKRDNFKELLMMRYRK